MKKTTSYLNNAEKLAVDLDGLAALLSVGRNTATEIGELSGATFKVGRRRLYSVARIKEYLEIMTSNTDKGEN